jgi:hypothetical protein
MEEGAAMKATLPLALALLGACAPHISGLMPLEPAPDGSRTDSLQPVFRWEPLPEASDPRVSELVYDVQLLDVQGWVLQERDGLTSCEYRPESPLAPDHQYCWTVRARFRWEGRRRQTDWSRLSDGNEAMAMLAIPAARYLPFSTPAPAAPSSSDAPPKGTGSRPR